ncbi:hypothetical protein Tco_1572361 [Tanacetum coccineum]
MRELREETFSGNKNEDAHDHIDRSCKEMGGQTRPRNYQYLGFPKNCLYPKGPIPGMTQAQALTAIQSMADHSQKGHDKTTSRNIGSSSSNEGLAALIMESVHAIQVGCQICKGPHIDKDCPLNEEVKQVEEVRYGEFGRTTPFNVNNRGKFHVGLMTSNNVYFIASFIPLIMEYLVNISKRRAFWSLNEDTLKITILKTNTPYPSRKIRRIRACTHQIPQRNKAQYAVSNPWIRCIEPTSRPYK